MSFSKNLKALRKKYNVTQETLAKFLNVTRPTIAGYETKNKEPDFDRLILIADFFGVSTDYLLKGEQTESMLLEEDNKDIKSKLAATEDYSEFIEVISRLSENDKKELLELAKLFYYRSVLRDERLK